jgi:hypothetical protein
LRSDVLIIGSSRAGKCRCTLPFASYEQRARGR